MSQMSDQHDSPKGVESTQCSRKRDLALVSRSTYMKEKALQYLFFACAFLAVVTVILIFAFTTMQAAPVFTDIGLANFFRIPLRASSPRSAPVSATSRSSRAAPI